MTIVDASVMIEVVLNTPMGLLLQDRLLSGKATLHAPHLLDLEVAQAVRRYTLFGGLDPSQGEAALEDLAGFPIERYPHDILLPRIWELRRNITAYDAAYVALAEVLDGLLLTRDKALSMAPGHRARVEVV